MGFVGRTNLPCRVEPPRGQQTVPVEETATTIHGSKSNSSDRVEQSQGLQPVPVEETGTLVRSIKSNVSF